MKRTSSLFLGMAAGVAIFASPGAIWAHGGGGGGFHGSVGGGGGYHGDAMGGYHGGSYGGGYGGYHGGVGGYGGYGGYHAGYDGIGGIGGYGGYGADHFSPIGPSMSRGFDSAPRTIQNPYVGGADRGVMGMNRPGEAARPGDLPRQDFNRPDAGDVGKFLNMPANRGTGAGTHPTANHGLSPEQRQNMNNRWNDANKNRPLTNNPKVQNWANTARDNFAHDHPDYNHWFGPGWWANHPNAYNGWYNRFGNRYPWGYWWGVPAWGALGAWMGAGWGDPVSYDYGTNVVYDGDSVDMNGQSIATPQEYTQSAYDIAAQTPAPAPQDATATASTDGSNWMPLGVFTLSTSEEDKNPTRVLQLAVNKDGSIGGTYYNQASDAVLAVQGSVDKTTQRACFTLGDDKQTVLETGIYNLTKDEAPVMIHFGNSSQETGELVRLKQPDEVQKTGLLPAANPQR